MSIFNTAIYNKQQVLWVFPGLYLPRGKYIIQYLTAGTAILPLAERRALAHILNSGKLALLSANGILFIV